ncbi:hypothetical protein HYH03_014648 [Edaphochlamys debaryana]|uniref:Uncharacterized protein n=1 Tax=Edaphochlamys debaryana TaxID=47281 RepID=A0A835XNH3_9CHLO|nr:hypothetical protein HYH03_014648 [Edaphochlamys debaryana]|eukprot:KAG2486720.1 hypothetical protein HYH03_014648 [Edaphochlamys debaryana]
MGISATAGAKAFSHTFSLAFTFAILTNLSQYLAWKAQTRRGTHWQRYGPAWLTLIAVPLLLADQVRHCLQDSDIWTGPSSRMYRPDCYPVTGLHGFLCLSLTGWVFSILCTYLGFVLLVVAVFWSSSLLKKLRHAWAQIRSHT